MHCFDFVFFLKKMIWVKFLIQLERLTQLRNSFKKFEYDFLKIKKVLIYNYLDFQ